MKKKLLLILAVALLTATSLFAFTDSFNSNRSNNEYNVLIKAVKDADEEGKVRSLYEKYMAKEKDPANITIMEYNMVRYWKDRGNDAEAQVHLERAQKAYDSITKEGVRKDIAHVDLVSADYYLTGSLSAGLESSNLTKQLYKDYPQEIGAILLEANRLTYAPHIGGGSPKRGLALFETLLPVKDQLQDINRFDLLAGLGIASQKRGQDENAIKYLEEAISIYSGDQSLINALDSLR